MIIGGINRCSMIDYPGKISCVVFTVGCNFRCPYCHNPELVKLGEETLVYDEDEFFQFLKKRRGLLEGVVVTGGEPTLHKDLLSFCTTIKQMGYPVKLDTNGSRPVMVKNLIDEGVVDYIAMDIKTDPAAYAPIICDKNIENDILSSIRLVMKSGIPYEFRTTCIPHLVDARVVETVCGKIKGASLYALQGFRPKEVLNPSFFEGHGDACDRFAHEQYQKIAGSYVKSCIVR